MTRRKVIFPPEFWEHDNLKGNTVPDSDRLRRILTGPLSELPPDLIHVATSVQMMVGAAPDGHSITVGLLFKAPPPIGAVEYLLTAGQITGLAEQLTDFIALDHAELAAVRDRLHGGQP
jgi:hypothetical protein